MGADRNHHTCRNKEGQGTNEWQGPDIVSITIANKDGGPTLAATDINAPTNAADVGKGAKQVWVHTFMWHETQTICRIPVKVSVDTGARGSNYPSAAFVHSVEHNGRGSSP